MVNGTVRVYNSWFKEVEAELRSEKLSYLHLKGGMGREEGENVSVIPMARGMNVILGTQASVADIQRWAMGGTGRD